MSEARVTWEQLGDMMRRALRELDEDRRPAFAADWLEALPEEFHESADECCAHYTQHGAWPQEIDEVIRIILMLRCLFVIDRILSRLARGETRPIDKGGRHIQDYLCREWKQAYVHWLALRNPNGTWNFPFDPWNI